ncbi:uncharacterized protein LOC135473979 isoform X2 [Liolophura sinensis]|uniref:uncharacterized protein LOC135473979 isoform X2 n=1 Tax=Liolophura sinensis TaxID=3198878 RepID=UPI0031585E45
MASTLPLCACLVLVFFFDKSISQTPRLLGKISAKHPGFLSLFENDPRNPQPASRYTLLAASFNGIPFSKDYVYGVPKVGTILNNLAGASAKILTESVTWPNDISGVPEYVFGPNMVAIPDGFLVPFKKKGSISILNITSDPAQGPYKISDDDGKTEWFYHKVIWKDMDKDGLFDAVTCRATGKELGGFDGQLVWFKNPGAPFFQTTWVPHVIASGPDVYLTPAALPIPDGELDTILIPGYFFRRLSVYWIEPNGTWTNPDVVKSRVIDDNFEIGPFFDVQVADVNGDGKYDLLATSSNDRNGSLIVYELPDDFRTGQFKKHVIASGFKPKGFGRGKSSPGSAYVFPSATNNTRPSIFLSGDDNGKAYILTPTSSEPNSWDYQMTTFLEVSSGPVGSIVSADVDGDNYKEVFVSAYEKGEINVFTLKP